MFGPKNASVNRGRKSNQSQAPFVSHVIQLCTLFISLLKFETYSFFFFFCASRLHFFIIFLFCLFIYRITLVFSFFRLSLSYSLSQTHSILIACLVTTRPHYSFTTARALCDGHIRNPTISAGIIAATSANTSRTCDASEKTNSVQWLVVCYVLPLPTDLSAIFASIYKAPGYYLGASTDAKPSTNTRFQIHPTIASFILLFFHLSDNNRNIRTGQILS